MTVELKKKFESPKIKEKISGAAFFIILFSLLVFAACEYRLTDLSISLPAVAEVNGDCLVHPNFVKDQYLHADKSILTYDQQRVCLYGATIYPSQSQEVPGGNWDKPSFRARIDWDFAQAQTANLNLLRVTNYADSKTADIYDPMVWSNMDYLISQAQAKGIFILLDLSSYAKHLEAQNINPYDPDQAAGWRSFIDFVTNRYKLAPNLAFYSIRGEVNPVGGGFPTSSTQGYLDFYQRTSDQLFQGDQGHHLIEAGGLTHLNQVNSGIPWQAIFSLSHIDLASIHVYSADRLQPIANNHDLEITMPMVATWAKVHQKPLDLQEYGIVNQVGDQTRAEAMNTITKSAISNHFQSIIFWNLGPETTPGMHYDINQNFPLSWEALIQNGTQFYSIK